MEKIFSSQQLKRIDECTIQKEPINSLDLMERASKQFVKAFIDHPVVNASKAIHVFCGTGNNGGDGFSIARLLKDQGYTVQAYLLQFSPNLSADCKKNIKRVGDNYKIIQSDNEPLTIPENSIVVDAIFGSGLSRPIEGFSATIIKELNQLSNIIFSVDVPSGLYIDEPTAMDSSFIKANYTITFQQPKLAFLLPENAIIVGKWQVVDIGLSEVCIGRESSDYYFVNLKFCQSVLQKRESFSHKGTFGKALLICGSRGKIGAAILAAKACLRSGVGLLSVQVPQIGEIPLQVAAPEAMVITDAKSDYLTELKTLESYDTIGVGPGIGTEKLTQELVKKLIKKVSQPMVIDADALNILALNKSWIASLPESSILTPHPKEFERLVGKWDNDFERLKIQRQFSIDNKLIIVLKGKYTSITDIDGKVYFNPTGNTGMATGGSGDVLTGIITGILAQRYDPLRATILGVYLHGLAGDLAKEFYGEESLLPTDLIEYISKAFIKLHT